MRRMCVNYAKQLLILVTEALYLFKVDKYVNLSLRKYNFDFSYLSMYQAAILIVAQLIPEQWTGNNPPGSVLLLLNQTEINLSHVCPQAWFIIY